MRCSSIATKSSPHYPKLEKALRKQQKQCNQKLIKKKTIIDEEHLRNKGRYACNTKMTNDE